MMMSGSSDCMMDTKGASSSGEMSPSASMKPRYRPRPMASPARSAWPLPKFFANEFIRRTTLSGKPSRVNGLPSVEPSDTVMISKVMPDASSTRTMSSTVVRRRLPGL